MQQMFSASRPPINIPLIGVAAAPGLGGDPAGQLIAALPQVALNKYRGSQQATCACGSVIAVMLMLLRGGDDFSREATWQGNTTAADPGVMFAQVAPSLNTAKHVP